MKMGGYYVTNGFSRSNLVYCVHHFSRSTIRNRRLDYEDVVGENDKHTVVINGRIFNEVHGWGDFGNVEIQAFLINFDRSGRWNKIGNRKGTVEIRSDRLQVARDYCPRGLHNSDFSRTPVGPFSAVILEDNSWHKPFLEPRKLGLSRNLP